MFLKSIFVLAAVWILILNGSADGKVAQSVSSTSNPSFNDKAPQPMEQTININNWGLGKEERKLLTEMKYKIDSLYEKSVKVCSQDSSGGWVRNGNSSFLVIDIPTLKWSDARRICQKLGGDLAIIKSTAENTFIFGLLKKQKTFTLWGAWIGFVRKADTKFYWIDDSPLAGSYTAWGSREPNNLKEKCGNMFGSESRGGGWNDLTCDLGQSSLNVAPVILCQK